MIIKQKLQISHIIKSIKNIIFKKIYYAPEDKIKINKMKSNELNLVYSLKDCDNKIKYNNRNNNLKSQIIYYRKSSI